MANIPIVYSSSVSKEDVIEALRAWMEKNNDDISCLEYWAIRKAKELGNFPYCNATIYSKFDNKPCEDIMKECGYNYESVNQFFKRGRFSGFDGRTYLSSIEKQVGDFLFELKKEGKITDYEYEKNVCEDRAWTCDFYVIKDSGNLWLEIDGMSASRKDPYNSGENEKIEYYKDNGFDYFVITYKLADIFKALKEKLLGE